MSRVHQPCRNERGVSLIVAILVLVTLAAIAVTMMISIISDRRIAAYDLQTAKALHYAEAGVAEGLERIRRRDVPDSLNPKMVTQVFLTRMGDVPVLGADSTALATGQPQGQWMDYSTPRRGPDVLTIEYKTDPAKTKIYRYDKTKNPPVQTLSGAPIFVITATGRVGSARRRLVTEVVNPILSPNIKGAAVAFKSKVEFKSRTYAIGYDYKLATPTGTSNNGARTPAWETGLSNVAAGYAMKEVKVEGNSIISGNPAKQEKMPQPYAGPWEVLGMTQTEFYSWIGEPNWDKKQGVPRGITYLDKPGGKLQTDKDKFEMKGGFNGDGLLYVNGKLEVKGDFTFRGLIYCEGEFRVHGSAWILGSVVARKVHLHPKKSAVLPLTVLKSTEAVSQNINKYGGFFTTLAWREVDPAPLAVSGPSLGSE